MSDASSPLSVAGLLHRVTSVVNFLESRDNPKPVQIRGVLDSIGRRPYGGWYYCLLKDEHADGVSVSLRVPGKLIQTLEEGDVIVVEGFLAFRERQGSIQPQFQVSRIIEVGQRQALRQSLMQAYRDHILRPKRDVERRLLQSPQPRILLVATETAYTDILSQVEGLYRELFQIEWVRGNMESPADVAAQMVPVSGENGGYDLIALARGGGDNVDALDDRVLLDAVVRSPIPVVTALGHARDNLVLDAVADLAFRTPTDFGRYLRSLGERKLFEQEARKLEDLEKEVAHLKKVDAIKTVIIAALASVLAVMVVLYLQGGV